MNETDDQQQCDTCDRTSGRNTGMVYCGLLDTWVNDNDVACGSYCGTRKEKDNGQ